MHPLQTELADMAALSLKIEGAVAHLVLNRPEALNTLNTAFWQELPKALRAIGATADIRALIISSTGKHFTAGMDLNVFAGLNGPEFQLEASRRAEMIRRWVLELQACFNLLEEIRIPVLMAVQGGCIGGGIDMIAAADCRYATEDAFFTIKEIDLAMTADLGTLQRLPTLMPQGVVRELAYTGRKFNAQEAMRHGLINEVYSDHDTMIESVMAIAQTIAGHSPMAIHGTKEMLNYARDNTVAEGLRYAATWQSGMFHAHEVLEAMSASFEKRAPVFENLQPNIAKITR
ncbi:crotonase/enoyl-CoA hydratase family protein [Simiduia curdlanivorans]|uniref:Crotonase/enoyl-CoA hydratase family protein n=1 Tax=Simiduia curdlanivorans TaxID=1492769 RepID=A0ABV8V175_9GAMM|nr:crotonase/enoyl-CoA hydratase family protein [Simiduia curdlanivorans]MDN3639221.1 crotonase/enoyl-CoA hydratase family protein [Simiduia curdlanivorans]